VAYGLVQALGMVSLGWLVADLLAWSRQRRVDGLATPDAGTVRNRMISRPRLRGRIENAYRSVLRQEAYPQGWFAGQRSARALISQRRPPTSASGRVHVRLGVDWSGWEPGDAAAARRLINGDGLRGLLAESDTVIKGIADSRLDDLAQALAAGLERGDTPQALARALDGVLTDESKALSVAWTETSRAISAAAMDEYAAAGIATKGWMTAHDERVCPICHGNAAVGFIPLGAPFPSGDPHPPGHPQCRCAPEPGPVVDGLDGA
jgi:SPP1 gp7 family putative phage head morphogenesis protein